MDSISSFMKKLSILLSRRQFSGELDEEMAFHREQAEKGFIAEGMTPEAARCAAVRQFGNATRLKERSHEVVGFSLEAVVQDLRFALRQLMRSPGFALATVITLALGVGATTSVFTLVQATLLRRLPYLRSDRILNITDERLHGRSTGGLVGVPRFFDLEARNESFASLGYFYFDNPTLIVGSQLPAPMKAVGVGGQFWSVFGVAPLLGRTLDERDTQPNSPGADSSGTNYANY